MIIGNIPWEDEWPSIMDAREKVLPSSGCLH